jgi:hypothetical protein
MQQSLLQLFQRDIQRLYKEVELYENESTIWEIINGTSNSGGNLVLHLVGNLNNYIGKILGNTAYIRNREAEFADKKYSERNLVKIY